MFLPSYRDESMHCMHKNSSTYYHCRCLGRFFFGFARVTEVAIGNIPVNVRSYCIPEKFRTFLWSEHSWVNTESRICSLICRLLIHNVQDNFRNFSVYFPTVCMANESTSWLFPTEKFCTHFLQLSGKKPKFFWRKSKIVWTFFQN